MHETSRKLKSLESNQCTDKSFILFIQVVLSIFLYENEISIYRVLDKSHFLQCQFPVEIIFPGNCVRIDTVWETMNLFL